MLTAASDVFEIASRPITRGGTLVVITLTAMLAVAATRSPRVFFVAALAGAYAARRIGLRTGFVKWLDHEVLERVSETFDNIEGWLIAFIVSAVVLASFRLLDRRRRSREPR